MASAIEILCKQAIKTFTRRNNILGSGFEENFYTLKQLADRITADDLKLNESVEQSEKRTAPVSYLDIYEDKDVTIGVFILKPGSILPLHDHPKMKGILKVLSGSVNIQTYTPIKNDTEGIGGYILAEKHPVFQLTSHDEACTLDEEERNLHEIWHTSSDDQYAAFLDILAPPYCDKPGDEHRDCTYFTTIDHLTRGDKITTRLKQIPSPSIFWCDMVTYFGDKINKKVSDN